MNTTRRKELQKALDLVQQAQEIVESCLADEQEYFDNMPESLQGGDRGSQAEDAINNLDAAVDTLRDAAGSIESAVE